MHTITATFEIVTPMFLGGADNKTTAELRGPALKNGVRWSWRALAWGRTAGPEEERLKQIGDWEDRLFGSAKTGQGAFSLQFEAGSQALHARRPDLTALIGGYDRGRCQTDDAGIWRNGGGIAYLAGQGLVGWQRGVGSVDQRHSFPVGQKFTILFRLTPQAKKEGISFTSQLDEKAPSILEAFEVFSLFGGLGARTRRGFGSLQIISCQPEDALRIPSDAEAYRRSVVSALNAATNRAHDSHVENVPFTAFTPFTFSLAIDGEQDWQPWQLHADVGHWFQLHRSNGFQARPGSGYRVNGVKARPNYIDDKTWMWEVINHASVTMPPSYTKRSFPERLIYGLPHAYGTRNAPDNRVEVNISREGRRASPLFLHIYKFKDSPPVAIWLFLPCRFSADQSSSKLNVTVFDTHKRGRSWEDKSGPWTQVYPVDFGPIVNFMRETAIDQKPRTTWLKLGQHP